MPTKQRDWEEDTSNILATTVTRDSCLPPSATFPIV